MTVRWAQKLPELAREFVAEVERIVETAKKQLLAD